MTSDEDSLRVLHLDDDPEFANLTATFLERVDPEIAVTTTTTTPDALNHLFQSNIDCIVSDYQLHESNGIEFLQEIRDDHPDLPFILFTGRGSEEVASEAISAGVTDYLQKGGGTDVFDVLANRIRNAVSKYRAEYLADRAIRAMDRSREGIALLDDQGEFIYVNNAYTDIVGYDKEELLGEYWEIVYPDDQIDRIYEDVLDAVPDSSHWTGDTVYQRKDGTRVLVNHALVYSEEDTMICLIRDVSDRKQQRKAHREEEQRFGLFVEAVDEYAIFLLDPEGYITTWNQGAEQIKGYDRDDILGTHFSVFYPEDARKAGRPDTLLDEARESGSVTDEGWRVRADGSQFWADVTITAVTDEDGTLRGFGKVTKDLTDRRERELELEQAQTQFDTLPDIFYVVDTDEAFIQYNDRLLEVTGYTAAELESMSALELVPAAERDQFRRDHQRLLGSNDIVRTESWLVGKDGDHIPYEFRRRRLTDRNGEIIGFAGIGRDISDRKEYERQLEQHVDRLNEFGSVLTHDLRNPLNVATGRLDALADDIDGQGDDHVAAINRSLRRIETIIDDVLEITRTGLPVTDPEPTNLDELVKETWTDLETGATHAELTVDDLPTAMADPSLLQRLLMNLFRNAIEHSESSVTVQVGKMAEGFFIADNGPGILAEDRETVFDWKYTTKESGSGIGLKSVQQIVDAHGWEISVPDGMDGGARFEITEITFV